MVAVGAVAAGMYLPTLWGEFVYDDVAQIVTSDYLHRSENFWEVLTFRVMGKDVMDFNRPVMVLSLMIDAMIWGANPFGYHLTNVVLHAACSVLLLLVMLRVFRRLSGPHADVRGPLLGALAGALLFAVHPLNSEAVSPVTFREDLLVAFFALAAFFLIEWFPARRQSVTLLLGAACTVLTLASVGSKESGAGVPAFLILYWVVVRRRQQWRPWAGLVAAGFVVVALFVAARFTLVPENSIITSEAGRLGGSFAATLRIQPRIWTFQLMQLFRPDLLCADQTVPYSIRDISLGFAAAALIVVIAGVVLLSIRNHAAALGAALYWLGILPASNLLPMYRPIADRYMYFPMAGFAMVIGAVVCRLKVPASPRARAALAAVALAALAVLGAFTVRRTFVWRDSMSLWSDTAARNTQSYTAYDNLGVALFQAGQYDKAVRSFQRCCRLTGLADPRAGLAVTYDAMGKGDLAEEALADAIRRDEHYADAARLVRSLRWEPRDAEKLQKVIDRLRVKRAAESRPQSQPN